MARNYLFLVHGVGKHEKDVWADPWKKALIRELKRYAPYDQMTPEEIERDALAIVPVSYDSVFEGYRKRWKDLGIALSDVELIENRPARKAIEWVADQEEDMVRTLFLEKILDIVLWQFFPMARAQVIAKVAEDLLGGLTRMGEENAGQYSAHIMAHSLGTSVTHDALLDLQAAESLHAGALGPKAFKWDSVFMVANTSRFLQRWKDISDVTNPDDFKVYTSKMEPGDRSSVCRSYFNVRHTVDPITWPRRFDAASWPDNAYSNIEINRYDELKDVHNLEDYLADPRVHLNLFRKVMGNRRIGKRSEVTAALAAHTRDFPKQAATEFDELRQMLGGDFERKLSGKELVQFLSKVFKELKR